MENSARKIEPEAQFASREEEVGGWKKPAQEGLLVGRTEKARRLEPICMVVLFIVPTNAVVPSGRASRTSVAGPTPI